MQKNERKLNEIFEGKDENFSKKNEFRAKNLAMKF